MNATGMGGSSEELAFAHLRNGDPYARLACGFEIGVATAWRYVREAVDLLACQRARGSVKTPFKRHR
jgi:hypothetical protein